MPRQARIDYPGAFQHVIGRGIEQKYIFPDESHKSEFYNRLEINFSRYNIMCCAWCIMGNHFHLLLQTIGPPLAELMRGIMTGYAVYYNLRHKRAGHLFQNRYKSILCEKDEYLLPLVRYIHLNPVKAGMIKYHDLERYKWTGHQEIVWGEKGLIKDKDEILGLFEDKKNGARENYK